MIPQHQLLQPDPVEIDTDVAYLILESALRISCSEAVWGRGWTGALCGGREAICLLQDPISGGGCL